MTLADELRSELAVHASKPKASHPKGWEPGIEWDGRKGWIISDPRPGNTTPEFEDLLYEFGFDPATHQIVGDIQVRRWQQRPGDEFLWYHKATIAIKSDDAGVADVTELCEKILQRKPRKKPEAKEATAAMVVNIADIQVGKGESISLEHTESVLADVIGQVEDQWRDLKKKGVQLAGMYVHGMGDLVESCSQHYPQQQFRTWLNERDQRKVVRWFLDSALDAWAKMTPWISVKAVGGNHGEVRVGGKSHTDFADNIDVAVFEDVAYAFSKNPDRYEHISFSIPNDDLTLTYEHQGKIIGLAHGHQAGFGSGDPKAKIDKWWRGQMAGQQPIGDADILFTGHYHTAWMQMIGKRTHFGCPTLDGGSQWFTNMAGVETGPGVLTVVIDADGWSNFEILGVTYGQEVG